MSKFIILKTDYNAPHFLNISMIKEVFACGELDIFFLLSERFDDTGFSQHKETYNSSQERDARMNELKELLTAPEHLQIYGEGHKCPQCQTIFTTSEFTKV